MIRWEKVWTFHFAPIPFLFLLVTSVSYSQNQVLGEIQFEGASKVERLAGVWVDGQYLGYLKELKGSKKVTVLPGEHEVDVRQGGYKDFTQKVVLEPGQRLLLHVVLERDPRFQMPATTAEIKMSVNPNRAAVFIDNLFAGHVDEFDGLGRALLVAPGKHRIKIVLPGYQDFETEVNLQPNQKFRLKTDLVKGSIQQADPLIKQN